MLLVRLLVVALVVAGVDGCEVHNDVVPFDAIQRVVALHANSLLGGTETNVTQVKEEAEQPQHQELKVNFRISGHQYQVGYEAEARRPQEHLVLLDTVVQT